MPLDGLHFSTPPGAEHVKTCFDSPSPSYEMDVSSVHEDILAAGYVASLSSSGFK